MATYLSPGVYVEEVPSGPQPIAAVSSSVLAVIGSTRRGPVKSPARITSWSDFQRLFVGNAADGYTAEAVYGFFQNGGAAAYVVRVDPSVAGTWQVKYGPGPNQVAFDVTASSPGSWAAGLTVSVAPDRTAGAATLFATTVTAGIDITDNNNHDLSVTSTAGLATGDVVTLLADDNAGTSRNATVMAVGPTTLTVRRVGNGNISLRPGCVVTIAIDPAAAQFTLSGGAGIKPGDVLVAETSARPAPAASWLVTTVSSHGASLVVTPAAPASAAVPGTTFGPRLGLLTGRLDTPTAATVALTDITWAEHPDFVPTTAGMAEGLRAWAADGMEGAWKASSGAGQNTVVFPAVPPAGPITVEVPLQARAFAEDRTWAAPTEALLTTAYSFLPTGSVLTLVGAGGTADADITRTATGFSGVPATGDFSGVRLEPPADSSATGVVLHCVRPLQPGDRIQFAATQILAVSSVDPVGGTLYKVTFDGPTADVSGTTGPYAVKAFVPTRIAPLRFALGISGDRVAETFKGLALDPGHPQFYGRDGVVNGVSSLVTVTAGAPLTPSVATTPTHALAGQVGADKVPAPQDYKDAVRALETEPEPAMLCCPDLLTFTDPLLQYDLVDAVVRHCETFRRFAVLDAPMQADDQRLLEWRNTAVSSTYAAVFAPFVRIVSLDPAATERYRWVPPSGFVAGVMARTDRDRGVHKAPGNEQVFGIVGLSQPYTEARQDFLNPGGVNVIRAFPGRGLRLWGARNATDDVQWRYISVRRLFNLIEVSVERATQWVVFEPNTATTWLRVKAGVEGFLDQLWRAGALAGASPQEAYRVRVGLGQTMTETDIDLGLIVTEVAVAPAKPAEFVIFRFSHKRLSD